MPSTEQRSFVDRLVAAANSGDARAWASFYSPGVTNHDRPTGREGMVRIFDALLAVFPDWKFDISEVIGDGPDIVALMTMTGTHLGTRSTPIVGGAIVDLPPTGKSVRVQHIHRYHIVDGEIADHHAVRDDLAMMQQLGLVASTASGDDISRPPA